MMINENDSNPDDFSCRWKRASERLIDELASGKSIEELTPRDIDTDRLKIWLKSPNENKHRLYSRYVGEKSTSEKILESLEAKFAEIDQSGINYRARCPVKVQTTVTNALIETAEIARNLGEWADFCAAPGIGKTEAKNEYIARMRKAEGFFCPVWSIELDESCISPKAVMSLIAREIPDIHDHERSDFDIAQAIIRETKGSRGLLFVDEGQHLADVNKKLGIPIINMLRRLIDHGCFGIVYLSNGEIYRRLSTGAGRGKGAYTQLLSRMSEFRREIGPYIPNQTEDQNSLTKEDVLSVAKAWGVSGVEEKAYCLKIAAGPGALRAMTNAFRVAMERYGILGIETLKKVRPL
jgi:DNA transposition AAA+ family ATPase